MDNLKLLSDEEIKQLISALDQDRDSCISYSELEKRLDEVCAEIAPEAKPHHLHHEGRDGEASHRFLRGLTATDKDVIPADEFSKTIKAWEIPSMKQESQVEEDSKDYMNRLSLGRRLRAYWSVKGPEILFLTLVVVMQLAFGVWQLVKYLSTERYRQAFGWGVVLAKTCPGTLYPTMFFLVFSVSRWFSTGLRKFYLVSRFINWDLSQSFHIKMSMVALCLPTLHAIGHLTGSFLYGSRLAQEQYVAAVLGPDAVPRPHVDYVRSLPGWSGLTLLGLFYSSPS